MSVNNSEKQIWKIKIKFSSMKTKFLTYKMICKELNQLVRIYKNKDRNYKWESNKWKMRIKVYFKIKSI